MTTIKIKPCKGSGKANGFGCGNPTKFRKYGLCQDCLKLFLLSDPGKEVIKRFTIKAKKQTQKEKDEKFEKLKKASTDYAKKLQEAAEHGEIMISKATYERVHDMVSVERIERPFRGETEPQIMYKVIGIKRKGH